MAYYRYIIEDREGRPYAEATSLREARQCMRDNDPGGNIVDRGPRRRRNPSRRKKAAKRPDLSKLEGPLVAKPASGKTVRGVGATEGLYYDPDKNRYYDPKTNSWFDISRPPKTKKKSTARAEKIKKLEDQLEELALALNDTERRVEARYYERAVARGDSDRQARKKAEEKVRSDGKIQGLRRRIQATEAMLNNLQPDRVPDKPLPPAPPPKGVARNLAKEARKGNTAIYVEEDPVTGLARVYFDDKAPDADFLRATLLRYVPKVKDDAKALSPTTANRRGARGFWAVGMDDLPVVLETLSSRARVMGAWDHEIGKKLRSLDAKARAARKRKLVYSPDITLQVGKDRVTGKTVKLQDDGIRFLISRDRAILADDMGIGKTPQAIIAAHNAVPPSKQILVLCPAAVAGNWQSEVALFEPGAPAAIVTNGSRYGGKDAEGVNYSMRDDGPPPSRGTKVRFVICSYQGAASRAGKAKLRKWLLKHKWGCVILDEAHRAKKPTTRLHKFIEKLHTDRMWMLTGTPIANRPRDLFGLLKLAHHPLGDDYQLFIDRYTPDRAKGDSDAPVLDRQVLKALGNAIKGVVLRRTKADVLGHKLPAKIGTLGDRDGVIMTEVPSHLRNLNALAKTKDENRESLRRDLAIAKAPATWDMAKRVLDAGEKVVLFTTYTTVMDEFANMAKQDGYIAVQVRGSVSTLGKKVAVSLFQGTPLSRDERAYAMKTIGAHVVKWVEGVPVSDWKASEVKAAKKAWGANRKKWPPRRVSVFIGQMVAASEGITLTMADVLLFNDLDYMPSRHLQAEDRIWRVSRAKAPHKTVYIGYMLARSDLDTKLYRLLNEKKAEIGDVYSATKGDPDKTAKEIRKLYWQRIQKAKSLVAANQRERRRKRRAQKKRRRKRRRKK